MSDQALSKGVVEFFNDCGVPVNPSAPTLSVCFMFFHFFGDSSREFSARVNLKRLWPFLNAFFRMASPRGLPKDNVCDNGTNIVGGSKELKKLEALDQKNIQN